MALSPRERLIAIGVGAAAALYVGDKYALEPYVQARQQVHAELATTSAKNTEAQRLLKRKKYLEGQERAMFAGGGLKMDQSASQFQVFDAVGDWAKEAGVRLTSRTPQPETRADRTQIIRLQATGSCSTAAAAKLLWRVETAPIPIKIDELSLLSLKPGSDELQLNLTVSTIWVKQPEPGDKGAGGPGGPNTPARRGAGREEGGV
jgi:hypothetical protein